MRSRNCLQFVNTRFQPRFFGRVRVAHLFSFLCCHKMCFYVLRSCCNVRYDFCIQTMFGLSLPPVVCRRVHVLFTLFVFVCIYLDFICVHISNINQVKTDWSCFEVSRRCSIASGFTCYSIIIVPALA